MSVGRERLSKQAEHKSRTHQPPGHSSSDGGLSSSQLCRFLFSHLSRLPLHQTSKINHQHSSAFPFLIFPSSLSFAIQLLVETRIENKGNKEKAARALVRPGGFSNLTF